MKARGAPYRGVLFAGLMIGKDGPKLIEFNARFGDPETQVMLPRLENDIVPLLEGCANGNLSGNLSGSLPDTAVRLSPKAALTVVYAARGYPDAPERGSEIRGVKQASARDGIIVYHAGTRRDGDRLLANGGRVLNVTALGDDVAEAQRKAYAAITTIDWPGGFYRNDIGWRAIADGGSI
jgi:phosphoribosylamine--glycine ligase